MATDFMCLEGADLDIPVAGRFLNHLEAIGKEAREAQLPFIEQIAALLDKLLEEMILGRLSDGDEGVALLGQGISRLQLIVDNIDHPQNIVDEVQSFIRELSSFLGKEEPEQIVLTPDLEVKPVEEEKTAAQAAPPTSGIPDESLMRDFVTEGLEYIDEIEINILNLEKEPENKDYINAIFRPFHSIKGVAGFLNLEIIRDLAHNLENLLDKARNGELTVTPSIIDVILDGADVLKSLIIELKERLEGRESKGAPLDISPIMERIALVEKDEGVPKAKKIGEILLEEGHITKDALEEGLKVVEALPGKKLGEVLIEKGKVKPKQVSQALRKQAEQITEISSIRVDTRKLDDLIDMIGELVITQSMVQQDLKGLINADRNLVRDISQLFRITSGLQRISMSLRMIPIKQTFQRMARLVRDLAKNSGKLIDVEMEGEETEIDRNMVDEVYNPLVHMVRNSVDHGIEMPEDRVKAGKKERGLIRLRAYHRGGDIVIEITDDGRGLDRDKIIEKAIKNGHIQTAEGMTDQEIYRLIFLPGLSTAEKITDVSGRGVGMDVVKQAVEKLRGKIEIESTPGRGTTFIASFPLTLAIIDGMIVKVGHQYYIIPTTAIRQAVKPRRENYNTVVGKGEMLQVMGQLLPLVKLYSLFGVKPEHEEPWDAIALVVEGNGRAKCLLVDKIIGKAEVVIKSLGEGFGKVRGIAGGAILGDGRVGLILDTEGIFALSEAVG